MTDQQFAITQPSRFNPTAEAIITPNHTLGGRANIQCKQNPTPTELKSGNYKPRLTLTKRATRTGGREVTLRVELSLPKLLYGNNFEELTEVDFHQLCQLLHQKLLSMGVHTTPEQLANTLVSTIHYGKNIVLPKYSTTSQYMSLLNKADINGRLDTNQTDYRNGGYSWKVHANNHEVAFYDKISDLQKAKTSEKRAIEKDNAIQLDLLEQTTWKQVKNRPEVLRMEVRLGNRTKIRSLLKSLGIASEPTFAELFKATTAQKVLLHYLDWIEGQIILTPNLHTISFIDFSAQIKAQHPTISPTNLVAMYGFYKAVQEQGVTEVKQALNKHSPHAWARLKSLDKQWGYTYLPATTLEPIRQAIIKAVPVKRVDFLPELINTDNSKRPSYATDYLLQH